MKVNKLLLRRRTDDCCFYCGQKFEDVKMARSAGRIGSVFSLEHLTPKSRGGDDEESNLVAACFRCNATKGVKTIEEYRNHLRWAGTCDQFSEEQIAWLKSNGIELPMPGEVTFFGEWCGYTIRDGRLVL